MSWKLLPDKRPNLLSMAQAFSKEECDGIINNFKGVDHHAGQNSNEASYSYVLIDPHVFPEIYERVTSVVLDCNVNNYEYKLHGISALYYVEFDKSQFMDWSMDLSHSTRETNKLSIHIGLNEDYEDGQFVIRWPRETVVAPKSGLITVFPSFLASRQEKPSKGIKKAILGTVTGLPFS